MPAEVARRHGRALRLLFTFAGGIGHLEPLVPLASAAAAAGHSVAFVGQHRAAALHFTVTVRRAVVGPQLQDIASVLR